jgi:hypothetical protein
MIIEWRFTKVKRITLLKNLGMLHGSCVIPHEQIIETCTDTDKCHFVSTEPGSKACNVGHVKRAHRSSTQLGLEADMVPVLLYSQEGQPPPYEEPPAYEPLASLEHNEEHGAADENETNAGMGNTVCIPFLYHPLPGSRRRHRNPGGAASGGPHFRARS